MASTMRTGTHPGTLPFNFNFNNHIPGHNHPSTFQTYTNMAGHPGWNNNHLGTGETLGYGGTGIGTNNNMFGMHGPAGPNLHFGSYPSQTGFPFTSGITAAPTTLNKPATKITMFIRLDSKISVLIPMLNKNKFSIFLHI